MGVPLLCSTDVSALQHTHNILIKTIPVFYVLSSTTCGFQKHLDKWLLGVDCGVIPGSPGIYAASQELAVTHSNSQ